MAHGAVHALVPATLSSEKAIFEPTMSTKVQLTRYLGTKPTPGIALAVLAGATLFGACTAVRATGITALGDLPGSTFYSFATAISSNGNVVVGYSYSSDGKQAFRWSQTDGMVGLGYLPGAISKSSVAAGVSGDGAVVVGYGKSTNPGAATEAFRWTQTTGIVRMGYLPGGSTGSSSATGVSADGSVVVGSSSSSNGVQAFRWTEQPGMVGLGSLPSSYQSSSQAYAVSSDGSVIVGQSTSGTTYEAFRRDHAGGMEGLGYIVRSGQNTAYAVSGDGAVVVGKRAYSGGWEAFEWTRASGQIGLGGNQANGVSGDGRVVVGLGPSTNAVGAEACVWTSPGGMRTVWSVLATSGVDMSHWRYLTEATGVSWDGRNVIGYGVNTNGDTEAFLADIGPTVFVSISGSTNQYLNLSWSGATSNIWLEFTASLPASEWATLAGPVTGTNYVFVVPANQTNGFYRVRAD